MNSGNPYGLYVNAMRIGTVRPQCTPAGERKDDLPFIICVHLAAHEQWMVRELTIAVFIIIIIIIFFLFYNKKIPNCFSKLKFLLLQIQTYY